MFLFKYVALASENHHFVASPQSAVGAEAVAALAGEVVGPPATLAGLEDGEWVGAVGAKALDFAANVVFVLSLQTRRESR